MIKKCVYCDRPLMTDAEGGYELHATHTACAEPFLSGRGRMPRLTNGHGPVLAAVLDPDGGGTVVAITGPEQDDIVCWVIDPEGNAFWGRYGWKSAWSSFEERKARIMEAHRIRRIN